MESESCSDRKLAMTAVLISRQTRDAGLELENQVIAKTARPRIPYDLPAGDEPWIQIALQTRTRDVCGNLEQKRWSSFLHLALIDGDLRSQ